jgi:hypothetical protein
MPETNTICNVLHALQIIASLALDQLAAKSPLLNLIILFRLKVMNTLNYLAQVVHGKEVSNEIGRRCSAIVLIG